MDTLSSEPIAHLFQCAGPHLCKSIAPLVVRQFPGAKLYMWTYFPAGEDGKNISPDNRAWISKIPAHMWGGYLEGAAWLRWPIGSKLRTILSNTVLPKYSLRSWWKIWKGPKRWVFHSCLPTNLPTQIVFKLMGKEVVAIHWGLPLGHIPFVWPLVNFAHRFLKKIFILMSPERAFFEPCGCGKKTEVLSYPCLSRIFQLPLEASKDKLNRVMILGNSTYNRDLYGPVLDCIKPGSWDRIICMLNYGREEEMLQTEAFVNKYSKKFGATFYAWRNTLPYDEYLKIMDAASFYIGPAVYQSGLGAIFNSIAQGKVVIIRGHNYKWLRELGMDVLNLDDMDDLSYEKLSNCAQSFEQRNSNLMRIRKYFDEIANETRWTKTIWAAFGGCLR